MIYLVANLEEDGKEANLAVAVDHDGWLDGDEGYVRDGDRVR